MAPRRIKTFGASPAARLTIWAFALYAVWQGAGIIDGGPQRWGSASFAVLRQAPHPTVTWGSLLILFGLVVFAASLMHRWWLKLAGLVGIAAWSLLFSAGAFRAAALSETVANTGGKTYALIAAVALILISIDESTTPETRAPNVA